MIAAQRSGRSEPVLPPRARAEVGVDQFLERPSADQVGERPLGGDVPDHQETLTLPPGRQITQEATDPTDGLSPALRTQVRDGEALRSQGVHLPGRRPVELDVVALAQPPVGDQRQIAGLVRQRSCLSSPGTDWR